MFQLLLCAAEVSLQQGNHSECLKHARLASGLSVHNSYLFFVHLLLCRAYAAENNIVSLSEEYRRCMELRTDSHIGWICLKFIESRYRLQNDSTILALNFEECSKDVKNSWNMWIAVYDLVQGLIAIGSGDFIGAEEFLMKACSAAGAICMEIARQQCDSKYISLAIRSLKKAKETSPTPLPIMSLLLAQAEASLGSIAKWMDNLRDEWFSWPPGMRPAELLFQMHLLFRQLKESSPSLEPSQSPLRWILQAIHTNPSCLRYWKFLPKNIE
ncbi:Tetratricopeptide repeat protein SKI3 [Forsythia ovata]|uniref:Tetratricopeptide repeat protein SKI3 n=1 Tax=Forsythia ovata TaxID=205694 RepID=A0ABD1UXX5_9LAMI